MSEEASRISIDVHLTDGTMLPATVTKEGLDKIYDCLISSAGPHGAAVHFQADDERLVILSADKIQYVTATGLPEEEK